MMADKYKPRQAGMIQKIHPMPKSKCGAPNFWYMSVLIMGASSATNSIDGLPESYALKRT